MSVAIDEVLLLWEFRCWDEQKIAEQSSSWWLYASIPKIICNFINFRELGVKKLPTIKSLQVEFAERLNEKKAAYAELKKVRDELRDLAVHTANYEELRDLEEREKRKEQEHGRD